MSRQISVTLKIVGKPEHDKQVSFAASLSGADIMNYITLQLKFPVPPKYFLLVEMTRGGWVVKLLPRGASPNLLVLSGFYGIDDHRL